MYFKVNCRSTPATLRNAARLLRQGSYRRQIQSRSQSSRESRLAQTAVELVWLSMHSLEAAVAHNARKGRSSMSTMSSSEEPPERKSRFTFAPCQQKECVKNHRIADLVASKTAKGEFFYGIEITEGSKARKTNIDFNTFLPMLPTFVSIVWLEAYHKVSHVEQVESLRMIRELESHIPAMPHVSSYRLTPNRLKAFLDMNFTNMLAIRGDTLDEKQAYHFCHTLVEETRKIRGNDVSICVAGHPLGYGTAEAAPEDVAKGIKYLKLKSDAGAEFIITQMCHTPETIVQFVRDVRSAGIETPIMVGVVVPENFKSYELIEMISKVRMPPELRAEAEKFKDDDAGARNFFVQRAVHIIRHVFDADVGVHGIQFYSMNKFETTKEVLSELRKLGIIKDSPTGTGNALGEI